MSNLQEVKMGVYRHFKGKDYELFDIGINSETGESEAVYRTVHRENYADNGIVYVRPLDMFLSPVDKEKYPDVKQEMRFEYVGPYECKPSIQELVTQLIQDNRAFQFNDKLVTIGISQISVEFENSTTVYLVTIEEDWRVRVVKCRTIQEVYNVIDNPKQVEETQHTICGDIEVGDYIVGCECVGHDKHVRSMRGWVVKILKDGFEIICDDEYNGHRSNCVKLEYGSISKLPMKDRL